MCALCLAHARWADGLLVFTAERMKAGQNTCVQQVYTPLVLLLALKLTPIMCRGEAHAAPPATATHQQLCIPEPIQ